MKPTCSLEEAAQQTGVGSIQMIRIIKDHPDIFAGVDTAMNPSGIRVPEDCLQAFQTLYKSACSFDEIVERLGVSIQRIKKVQATPGSHFLKRSFCSQAPGSKTGRPQIRRLFPRQDAEAFIDYCTSRSIFTLLRHKVTVKTFTYDTLENCDIVSASKAYQFQDAVEDGFCPEKFRFSNIDPGVYTGKLVFKVWGRRATLQCFFILEDEQLIRLTAFRPHATPWRGFTPRDGRTDFSRAGIEGTPYRIKTGLTQTGAVSFLSARVIRETPDGQGPPRRHSRQKKNPDQIPMV